MLPNMGFGALRGNVYFIGYELYFLLVKTRSCVPIEIEISRVSVVHHPKHYHTYGRDYVIEVSEQ